MEITNEEMIKKYGINEWKEKSIVLRDFEIDVVLDELAKGKTSSLTEIVRKPFPEFATLYFGCFKSAQNFLTDPAFGYKLYMLSFSELKEIVHFLRGTKSPHREAYRFREYLMLPLEKIPTIMSSVKTSATLKKKFIYLTGYINLEEAKRLNMSLVPNFVASNEDGYELNKKLELLNPTARSIIENYYGLNGKTSKGIEEISEFLNMSPSSIKSVIDFLEPSFFRPYGELVNKIEPRAEVNGLMQYGTIPYRQLDVALEIQNYYNNKLSELEKSILPKWSYHLKPLTFTASSNETSIYIAGKYLFPSLSSEELANYLILDYQKVREANRETTNISL